VKTVVIIQARVTSTRLPAKVLQMLGDQPVLAHVIDRAKMIEGASSVWCAFPDDMNAVKLQRIALEKDVASYLGSEKDVLERYARCAEHAQADVVVRITADCPLIDPKVCADVIKLRDREFAPYASNVWPRSFPHGLDCEVFTMDVLAKAHKEATDEYDREHVTPWIIRNSRRVNLPSGYFNLARHRWTIDYIEDLSFMQRLFALGNPQSMQETLALIAANPSLQRRVAV